MIRSLRSPRLRRAAAALGLATIGVLGAASTTGATAPPDSVEDQDAAATSGADGDLDCAAIAESVAPPPEISTFLELAVQSTGGLDGPGTILVPIDSAFAAIPENVLSMITADPELLDALVGYHYIADELLSLDDLVAAETVASSIGAELDFAAADDGVVEVNGDAAMVLCADIANGGLVIHVIDGVLQPPTTGTGAPGSSVPGSSVPGSSVPGSTGADASVPGSSVPAFDADGQEIAAAWQTVTDSASTVEEVLALVEDGEAVRETIENYPTAAEAVLGITSEVRTVTIVGEVADITFVLFFNGVEAPYGELPAQLAYVDGSWIVPQAQYCEFQGMARNPVPCGDAVARG